MSNLNNVFVGKIVHQTLQIIDDLKYTFVYWPENRSEINWLFKQLELKLKEDGYLDFEKDPPQQPPRRIR